MKETKVLKLRYHVASCRRCVRFKAGTGAAVTSAQRDREWASSAGRKGVDGRSQHG